MHKTRFTGLDSGRIKFFDLQVQNCRLGLQTVAHRQETNTPESPQTSLL